MSKSQLFIGLMSGTSADGVDAALIETTQDQIKLIDFISTPLPSELKHALIQLNTNTQIELQTLCLLQKEVADVFSKSTLELLQNNRLNHADVCAIGSHGQTIYHAPEIPMSIQIGHPAFIAKSTGITTVADFRIDDMALGGQGAPFAPAFHKRMFSGVTEQFVVNIGGIANISYLNATSKQDAPIGWDTGPGNALMDDICQTEFNSPYDENGSYARQGSIHKTLLKHLLSHPYLQLSAPKSTGRDTFHASWVRQLINEHSLEVNQYDLLATVCELTAISISQQINSIPTNAQQKTAVWIVGGGAHNDYLLERLQFHLANHLVKSSKALNIDPDAIEAMMFAWLAQQRLQNHTIALAAVTGATRDGVLGGIWHP
ncbi:MAG: anhydro-N-acetylmuramic acid kinase [Thiomicrorhabdus sp.]|nr:anhydro-N-acetylmuramic acid kinase [Thiomicrorhabdus sp.]